LFKVKITGIILLTLQLNIKMDFSKFENNQKLYQQFRDLLHNKQLIVIDGLIGAGKSTLIKLIVKENKYKKKIHPIYEPVDIWRDTGALQLFYQDIPAKCMEFQTFTFITRIKRIMTEVIENPDVDIYLLERSVFTDRYIFVELLREMMGPTRMKMYEEWWDMWSLLLPLKFNKWILIDTSLEESINRICKRDRKEESGISIEYQKNLYDKHHQFFQKLKDIGENTVIIPKKIMDENYLDNREKIKNIMDMIFKED